MQSKSAPSLGGKQHFHPSDHCRDYTSVCTLFDALWLNRIALATMPLRPALLPTCTLERKLKPLPLQPLLNPRSSRVRIATCPLTDLRRTHQKRTLHHGRPSPINILGKDAEKPEPSPQPEQRAHPTRPTPLTDKEYQKRSERFFQRLLLRLEEMAEERGDMDVEYSVRLPSDAPWARGGRHAKLTRLRARIGRRVERGHARRGDLRTEQTAAHQANLA